jgi:hypothetical protein
MQAFPCPMGPDFPECDRGMTLHDFQVTHFAAAWVQVLASRRNEPGYTDEAAANHALRLGLEMAAQYYETRK